MPERVQRRRTSGWRMPEGAVYVGRPTMWGNEFTIGPAPKWPRWGGPRPWQVTTTDGRTWHPPTSRMVIVGRAAAERSSRMMAALMAVDLYREALRVYEPDGEFWAAIQGRDLACWCPLDQPCHADVLLRLANNSDRSQETAPREAVTDAH